MPGDPAERDALIDDIFDWLDRDARLTGAEVNLFRGDEWVQAQHDGMPGALRLRGEEFAQLRDAWERRDLADIQSLRVPSEEQRLEAFTAACKTFFDAVMLRMRELQEPGRKPNREELVRLSRVAMDALGVGVEQWRRNERSPDTTDG